MPHPVARAVRKAMADHGPPLLLFVDPARDPDLSASAWAKARPLVALVADPRLLDADSGDTDPEDGGLLFDCALDDGGTGSVHIPWPAIFAAVSPEASGSMPLHVFGPPPTWMGTRPDHLQAALTTVFGRLGLPVASPPWQIRFEDDVEDMADKRQALDAISRMVRHDVELLVRDRQQHVLHTIRRDAGLDIGGMQVSFTQRLPDGGAERRKVRVDQIFAIRAPWDGFGLLWPADATDEFRQMLAAGGVLESLEGRAGISFRTPVPNVAPRLLQPGPGADRRVVLESLRLGRQPAQLLVDPARVLGALPPGLQAQPVLVIPLSLVGAPDDLALSPLRIEVSLPAPEGRTRIALRWDAIFAAMTLAGQLWTWPEAYPPALRHALQASHSGAPPEPEDVGFAVGPELPNGYIPVAFEQAVTPDLAGGETPSLQVELVLPLHPDDR